MTSLKILKKESHCDVDSFFNNSIGDIVIILVTVLVQCQLIFAALVAFLPLI